MQIALHAIYWEQIVARDTKGQKSFQNSLKVSKIPGKFLEILEIYQKFSSHLHP